MEILWLAIFWRRQQKFFGVVSELPPICFFLILDTQKMNFFPFLWIKYFKTLETPIYFVWHIFYALIDAWSNKKNMKNSFSKTFHKS